MKKKRISFKFLASAFCICLMGMVSYAAWSPNRDLHFFREIPSNLSTNTLNRHVSSATRWPRWFFSMSQAQVIQSQESLTPTSDQTIKNGSLLLLKMDPKKGSWKRFNLIARVMEYSPEQELRLQILDDSTHRLTRLFDRLEWKIEFRSEESKTYIRGSAIAHTDHWKSRFFGGIAEKILMNQVFYPDLMKLSSLNQPFEIDIPFAQFNPTGL